MKKKRRRRSRYRSIDPRRILTLHKIKRPQDLRLLIDSLRRDGWSGRRLLVEEYRPGHYQAWTGSHRLAAARRAGLRRIPVLVIDLKKWVKCWGPIEDEFAVDDVHGGDDEDKYMELLQAGDRIAANLMRQEIEMNWSAEEHGFV